MKEISSTDTVYLAHILGIYNVSRWYPIFKKKWEDMYIRIWYFKRYLCLTEITIRQLEFSFHWKQCPLNVGEKKHVWFLCSENRELINLKKKKTHSSWLFNYYEEKKSRIKKSNNAVNTYQFFHVWYFRTIQA